MNAFENMGTEGKTDHDLLVEMHTHMLGRGGLMERVEGLEEKVEDVRQFKTKWATVAAIIVGLVTVGASWLKSLLVYIFTKPGE